MNQVTYKDYFGFVSFSIDFWLYSILYWICVGKILSMDHWSHVLFKAGILTYDNIPYMGRGGGQVVSVLTFYSADASSNLTEAYIFVSGQQPKDLVITSVLLLLLVVFHIICMLKRNIKRPGKTIKNTPYIMPTYFQSATRKFIGLVV